MAEAPVLSSKPTLKDINKYNELDEKWYSIGIELGLDDEELDDMEEKYSDPHRRTIKMFSNWLKKGEVPTYKKLIRALVNVDKTNVAESICSELGRYTLIRKHPSFPVFSWRQKMTVSFHFVSPFCFCFASTHTFH